MTQQEAQEIANDWKYDGVYSFYDTTADAEDYSELFDAKKRGDRYFSCYSDNELVGYYCIEILEENKIELGLGLNPEHTGKGLGLSFVNAVMNYIVSMYGSNDFFLSVALFNERAIKVYKKAGFTEIGVFIQNTNGGDHEFLRMMKKCKI